MYPCKHIRTYIIKQKTKLKFNMRNNFLKRSANIFFQYSNVLYLEYPLRKNKPHLVDHWFGPSSNRGKGKKNQAPLLVFGLHVTMLIKFKKNYIEVNTCWWKSSSSTATSAASSSSSSSSGMVVLKTVLLWATS